MHIYLGWDVGAWHCDRGSSRDALVALREGRDGPALLGRPWRGNLRAQLSEIRGIELAFGVLKLCQVQPGQTSEITTAIDTPLGWPDAFRAILAGEDVGAVPAESARNAVQYRATERFLAELLPRPPLSAVKDMIGSQSTKGLYFLSAVGVQAESVGVWKRGHEITVTCIEAYPAPVRLSASMRLSFERVCASHEWLEATQNLANAALSDIEDALLCALIAQRFSTARADLIAPIPSASRREGWIWIPSDVNAVER